MVYRCAGLRAEYTDVKVSGVNEQLSALVILDQTELGQEFGASVNIDRVKLHQSFTQRER